MSFKRHFAGLSKNSFLLAAASFFADTSTEMLYPVLPVFLTQTLKASGSIVGLVEGCAQAAQNIVQGFSGALSDRLQKRKGIALVGYLAATLGKPLMGISTVWQGVFGARLLDHLYRLCACTDCPNFRCTLYLLRSVSGNISAVGKAFASDFVPENLRASGVGLYSSTVGLLQLLASVVAGLLWDRVGHAAVFYYGAIFGLAGSIGLIVLIPKRDHPSAA